MADGKSYGIERLLAVGRELERSGDGLHRSVMSGLKDDVSPIANRARLRYLARRTLGRTAAATVRVDYSADRITVRAGGRHYPWGAVEFGANVVTTVRGHQIDYSNRFGKHLGQTGYGLTPAVRLGLGRANRNAEKRLDEITGRVARAAGGR